MSERQGGSEGGFDWKKSRFVRAAAAFVGVLGIAALVVALA